MLLHQLIPNNLFMPGTCPSPYEMVFGTCIQFLNQISVDFDDARYICQSSDGDLATFEECELMDSVIAYIEAAGIKNIFFLLSVSLF